jgi:hypothetical protein
MPREWFMSTKCDTTRFIGNGTAVLRAFHVCTKWCTNFARKTAIFAPTVIRVRWGVSESARQRRRQIDPRIVIGLRSQDGRQETSSERNLLAAFAEGRGPGRFVGRVMRRFAPTLIAGEDLVARLAGFGSAIRLQGEAARTS